MCEEWDERLAARKVSKSAERIWEFLYVICPSPSRSFHAYVMTLMCAGVRQGGLHRWRHPLRSVGEPGRVQEQPGLHAHQLPAQLPHLRASIREGTLGLGAVQAQ